MATDDEKLLTKHQVAERLGVSPITVRDWAREGKIPVVRLSPRLRELVRAAAAKKYNLDATAFSK